MGVNLSDTWLKKQAASRGRRPPHTGTSDITGFGVRIFAPTKRHPAGARSFFVNYRIGGREKRFTIGSYPDWSAEAARARPRSYGDESIAARTRPESKTQREAHSPRPRSEIQRGASPE